MKFWTVLIIALSLFCLFSFSVNAKDVNAKDVYVKSGAGGTGESVSDPVGFISHAVNLLGDAGGTVYVVGEYPLTSNFTVPEISGDITFKGLNGGSLSLSADIYGTVNTNDNVITFDLPVTVATAEDRYIFGGYNSITFGDNFAVISKNGGMLNFYGGVSVAKAEKNAFEGITNLPYNIVVNAGTFNNFTGGNFRSTISGMYGSIAAPISITVNGGTFGVAGDYPTDSNNKNYKTFSVSGMSILASDATLTVNGGTFNCPIYIQGRTDTIPQSVSAHSLQKHLDKDFYAMDGDISVNITGGIFNGGMIGAYYTHASYTQLLRGNFDVNISGGTFKEGTKVDATQVKAYEGENKKATLTYSNVSNITPVRFDIVNGETVEYDEPIRVVFIGDSVTEGYVHSAAGVSRLTDSYPAKFLSYAEAAGEEVVVGNYGISGSGFLPSNAYYYGNRVTWNIVSEETDPDYVFMAMGLNDAQGAGGTNGGLETFAERLEYFSSVMGEYSSVKKVFITNAIINNDPSSCSMFTNRVATAMRPIQERVANKLAAVDSRFVLFDLCGFTREMAITEELFKDDNGIIHEYAHPARAGHDFMGLCCYNAAFKGEYVPDEYRLTDIYVSDSGNPYGKGTADDPISAIDYAFTLMKPDVEVTLHIVGTVTIAGGSSGGNAALSMAPSKLTVVGEGTDAVLSMPLANTFKIYTDTKFDNLTLKGALAIVCGYNNIEITDSVKIDGTWDFYAGYNVYTTADPFTTATFDTVESASSDKDCIVTINGGTYKNFCLGNGRAAAKAPFGTYSGTMTATIGANVTVGNTNSAVLYGINGRNYLTGTINATINNWGDRVINEYVPIGSVDASTVYEPASNTGDINITLADGVDNDVIVACDFDGNGKVTVNDFLISLKYCVNGFDTEKAANYYGQTKLDSLRNVIAIAKKAVK